MKKIIIFFLFIISQANVINNSFRVSYQNLHFDNENLGLVETSYLFGKNLYAGIGIYSAVSGKRGGFFTGGIESGYKIKIDKYVWDNGLFVGGGGGGSAPQGSGLMIKIHSAILYTYKNYQYGFNINKITFPDGDIDSTQIGFQIDYLFDDIYFFNNLFIAGKYDFIDLEFRPFFTFYNPISSKNKENKTQKQFGVIGAEIRKNNDNYFTFLEAGGALIGDSDGYAEYLFGIGKRYYVNLKASIGFAGGGRVNTKGGGVYKLAIQKDLKYLNFEIGYYSSIQNGIKAYYSNISLDKKFNFLTVGDNRYISTISLQKFDFKIYNESYLPSSNLRKNNNSKRLDNLNIDIDYYLDDNLFMLITAGAGYRGDSGGYAVGMLGMGYQYKNLFTKLSIGAGGGGSVDVGDGLISKVEIGIKYKNLFSSIGKINAIKGNLNTYFIDFGYQFSFYKGEI